MFKARMAFPLVWGVIGEKLRVATPLPTKKLQIARRQIVAPKRQIGVVGIALYLGWASVGSEVMGRRFRGSWYTCLSGQRWRLLVHHLVQRGNSYVETPINDDFDYLVFRSRADG